MSKVIYNIFTFWLLLWFAYLTFMFMKSGMEGKEIDSLLFLLLMLIQIVNICYFILKVKPQKNDHRYKREGSQIF